MVLLAAAGWSSPRISEHLGWNVVTVRRGLKAFQAQEAEGLHRKLPGPEPQHGYRRHVEQALEELLGEERTWTATQLSEALTKQGIRLGARQVRRCGFRKIWPHPFRKIWPPEQGSQAWPRGGGGLAAERSA